MIRRPTRKPFHLLPLLALALASAATATAAEPTARLTGPARVEPRGHVLLDPSGSIGDDEPEVELARGPAPVAVVSLYGRDGRVVYALASPPEPGTYLFVLIATGTPEGKDRPLRAYAFHEVVVGSPAPVGPSPAPAPAPGPAPAPSPTPVDDLAGFVSREAGRIEQPAEHRAAVAAALARSYRAVAAQSAAGIFGEPAAMLAANREAVRLCLGNNLDAWKPFLDALAARLRADRVDALDELTAAWEQIARGLEAVR